MKTLLLLLLLISALLSGCSTIHYQTGYYAAHSKHPLYSHTITDKLNLPNRVLISDEYLKSKNKIFIVNEDYATHYSKLVEYDLSGSTISKEIASFDGDSTRITDAVNDNAHIVYVVRKTKGKNVYKDIYLYDMEGRNSTVIKSDIHSDTEGMQTGYYLFVAINKNFVYWINPDLENKSSEIMEYNMTDHSTKVIYHQSFLDTGAWKNMPLTYLSLSDNCLVFNSRSNEGKDKIVIFDVNTKSNYKVIDLPPEYTYTYYGVMDNRAGNIFLYSKSGDADLIYSLNIQNQAITKLVGFLPKSYLHPDKFNCSDNKLLYSIQQDFTGYVRDHHFCEIYDLDTMQMLRYQYAFNIVKTDEYFAFLRWGHVETDNVDLIIYQLKDDGPSAMKP
jgi:hypothetical protein